jgi:hypothetical protein
VYDILGAAGFGLGIVGAIGLLNYCYQKKQDAEELAQLSADCMATLFKGTRD